MRGILLLTVLTILAVGCSDDAEPLTTFEQELPKQSQRHVSQDYIASILCKDSLRILDIGNSYTEDVTAFLQQVAAANKVDIKPTCVYAAVRGSASFKTWYDCYYDRDYATQYYIRRVFGGIEADAETRNFEPGDGTGFRRLLQQNKWDVIIIHQASTYAPYYEQWFGSGSGGYLGQLLALLKELQPQALIGTYLVHSYWSGYPANTEHSSYDRWQLTANSVAALMESGQCDIVIPYGTAIENLRQSSLNNEYDLTRDGTHLELGLARYAAACCYYETLFAPRYGVSMVGQTFYWDGQNLNPPYTVINVDEMTAAIAQQAAAMAVSDWRHSYPPEESETTGIKPFRH